MQSVDIRIISRRNYQLLADVHVETSKYKILVAKGTLFNGADGTATIPNEIEYQAMIDGVVF